MAQMIYEDLWRMEEFAYILFEAPAKPAPGFVLAFILQQALYFVPFVVGADATDAIDLEVPALPGELAQVNF
jgi:hypothetical protein